MSITIKEPYVIGEKTSALDYQFQDSGGVIINITGFAAEYHVQERFGAPSVLSATIPTGTDGKVRHVFTGTEFTTPGDYTGQFIVGNGTNRYASVRIKFTVASVIGTMPNI